MPFLLTAFGYALGVGLILLWVGPLLGIDFVRAAQASGSSETALVLIFSICPVVIGIIGQFASGVVIARNYERTGHYDFSHLGFLRNVLFPFMVTHFMVIVGSILLFIGQDTFYSWMNHLSPTLARVWLLLIAPCVGVLFGKFISSPLSRRTPPPPC